jgi:hypothetical protein
MCLGMNTAIILRSQALFSEENTVQWTIVYKSQDRVIRRQ